MPLSLKTSASFVVIATLVVASVGYLASADFLPIGETVGLEGSGLQFIRVWLKLAIAVGLVLPTIAFVIGFKRPKMRRVFGFYLLILAVQIITEQLFSQRWMPSLVVPIGTLYTAFRVWQLQQGLKLVQSTQKPLPLKQKVLNGVLWLLLGFWSSNLVMLLAIAWPSILQSV